MPEEIRVVTGDKRWMLQDKDGHIYWVDLWAIEAIAKIIRHVDNLGDRLQITVTKLGPGES